MEGFVTFFGCPTEADEAMPGCEDPAMMYSHDSTLTDSPSSPAWNFALNARLGDPRGRAAGPTEVSGDPRRRCSRLLTPDRTRRNGDSHAHGPENMAVVKHMALNIPRHAEPTTSLKIRRKLACGNFAYLDNLIEGAA